eukprot:gnl/TRDRNA2_/TRDRNA2_168210_c1_seq1.p1 gnl/TRDRNA2_/TRDRNA2_168210_c1~~gnl/TRDRNA2_/TRDRNA2_168210_c1_seq1.p1  ORF type:complete len:417 (-),score=70.99 gnl/TRDRNA2_/TRDRNA2_168210_c1_seq1:45-1154(-)
MTKAKWVDTMLAKDFPHLQELCLLLPKVELHQHLTGSLPSKSVRKVLTTVRPSLVEDASPFPGAIDGSASVPLSDAWDLLVKFCDAVAVAAASGNELEALLAEAIEDLAKDNVAYCELRIGLKNLPTKRQYLDRLVGVIRQQRERHPNTTVRLLISVARHSDVAGGAENIDIAIEHFVREREPVVCGVELGGVATQGAWEDFEPMFSKARRAGLPVALHCGEDQSASKQEEWRQMLAFAPQRLGHCVHMDASNLARVVDSRTPVEACLVCHKLHFGIPISENIFGKLFPTSQVVLGTDNPAFYETRLSREYDLCCQHHGLRLTDLFSLARRAIDFTFQSETSKATMRKNFDRQLAVLLNKFNIAPAGRL